MIGAHAYADLFPLMEGDEFDRLVEDIRVNGLLHPIVRYNNAILDGRNRYRACEIAERGLMFTDYTGNDPLGYVLSANLSRRHLDASQRAIIAEKVANLRRGRPVKEIRQKADLTQMQAARALNVSPRSVQRVAQVRANGTPDLIAAMDRGAINVSMAAKLSEMPLEVQVDAVQKPDDIPFILARARPSSMMMEPMAPVFAPVLPRLRKAWAQATPQERTIFLAEIGCVLS